MIVYRATPTCAWKQQQQQVFLLKLGTLLNQKIAW
jgi:hypothetical protein